jgi:hypothetical protein
MRKSVPLVIALLMHSIFLAIVPVVIITLWSGLTFRGITIGLLVFLLHTAGILGILKRTTWGYSFIKRVFGFYMVMSGLGFLGSLGNLIRGSKIIPTLESAIFFGTFTWLFLRFRSDLSVRAYFEKAGMTSPETADS